MPPSAEMPYHDSMAAVTIQNVTKQYGPQVVLENVSLELHAGETVGVVGANGAGKTTLFRLIVGDDTPDMGTVTTARSVDVGLLKQEPEFITDRTLANEVGSVFEDLLELERKLHRASEEMAACSDTSRLHELMDQYERINARFIAGGGHTFESRLNEVLGGVGFTQADHALPMAALSGGQKCRAALAKLLLEDHTLLLLDEPTNHLDIDAVRWLEKYLAGYHGGAVVISHDRYLLDRICTRIIEVADRKVASIPGNYSNYAKTRHVRELTRQRAFEQDTEFIRKEREYIAKYIAGQRTKQVQGRLKRLERRLKAGEFVTEAPRANRTVRLAFEKTDARAVTPLRCDDLSMSYGDNRLFADLAFQVPDGSRFGITGPNGTGKSTLLQIILGEVTPTGGQVTVAPKHRIGYYAQEPAALDPKRSVLDEVRSARSDLSETTVRSLLGAYLFTRDEVFKPLGALSGGEQSRVRLARLILTGPDLLILDEPTNHLDIASREVLEEALLAFGGTIVVVSHDRYFLDRIVDHLLVIRSARHTLHAGNYSAYLEQAEAAPSKGSAPRRAGRPARSSSGASKPKRKRSPYDKLSLDELEKLVIEQEATLAGLHERFGDPDVCRDAEAMASLRGEFDACTEKLAALNEAWEQRAEAE